ncbi:potassium channel family protein [Coraliomargarita parva]|uniref:potassium channel family protein n=1 Tax=Coraliomargarita parva TaxID=3014050 RepID=UPI0022B32B5D|nr:potassium channel protein [Coraliomargarita parva]
MLSRLKLWLRPHSERSPGIQQIERGTLLFVFILLVGTVGYELIAGFGYVESLYMTIITIFSVGYGDAGVDTAGERFFTMALILSGTTIGLYIAGGVIRIIAEGEINRVVGNLMKSRNIEGLSGHTIICGYGRIGQIIAQELEEEGFSFVIVDLDEERIAMAEECGFLTVRGSAEDEAVLEDAGIKRAKSLITVLPIDSINVFITLTARNLNRSIRIIARGEQPSTKKKLEQAGADEVVLPAAIGASRMAESILRPTIVELFGDSSRMSLLSNDLKAMGLELDELALNAGDEFVGHSIREFEQKSQANFIVLAIRRADQSILQHPAHDTILKEGDNLIILSNPANITPILNSHTRRRELA